MAAGHRHDGERAASALADEYYESAKPLVDACTVDDSFDVPWLANRTRDLKTVWVDQRVPKILKCGINTRESLPWHEIPEGQAMDDGLPYDEGDPSAHCDVATPLERRNVESQKPDDPDIWKKYEDEMDGYIRAVDDETIERVPLDMDLRVFAEDDRALLEKIMAKQAEEEKSAGAPRRLRMPSRLITPADMIQAVRGLNVKDPAVAEQLESNTRALFYDAKGARIAKAVGIAAQVSAGDAERSVDFVISTGALDRYNSTIDPKGWQLDNYKSNSVVLWAHDDSIPAIARGEDTRIDGKTVRSSAVFASREVHPLADTIYGLIRGKFIGAASVGWIPLKWQFVDEEGRGFGVDYLESELLEWSVVNIPANPECLVDARSMGIDTKPLMVWAERTIDLGGLTAIPRDELEKLRKAAGTATSTGYRSSSSSLADSLKLFTRAIEDLGPTRAGKVLSAENKRKLESCADHLKSAGDHCTAAADHVRSVMESCRDDDADDDDSGNGGDDGAAAAAAQEQRARIATVLRLRAPAEG